MALRLIYFVIITLIFFSCDPRTAEAVIGINWGRSNYQQLLPSMVVDILLQNKISEVRVYDPDLEVLDAFVGSGIGLTICIVENANVSSPEKAAEWLQKYITPYYKRVKFNKIYVGNEPFNKGFTLKNTTILKEAVDAVIIMQSALNNIGLGQEIKATTGHTDGVFKVPITRPSEAEFDDFVKDEMSRLSHFLYENDSPFVVETLPIAFLQNNSYDFSFSFADNKSTVVIIDEGGLEYNNIFHFTYDCYVCALRKLNLPDMKVVVGMIGWPTDGWPSADVDSAERFYKYLLPAVAGNRGTPMRPGEPIDIYVHALTDENKNPYAFPFSRHWGIYRTNGEPKYKIDLSGQGRDIYPTTAKGISRMPERWCVLDEISYKEYNVEKVIEQMEKACTGGDCTSLSAGGSCGSLNFEKNVSYAFNMYFQNNFQSEEACLFEGLGKVVIADPSVGTCVFAIEVAQDRGIIPSSSNRIYTTTISFHVMILVLFSLLIMMMK